MRIIELIRLALSRLQTRADACRSSPCSASSSASGPSSALVAVAEGPRAASPTASRPGHEPAHRHTRRGPYGLRPGSGGVRDDPHDRRRHGARGRRRGRGDRARGHDIEGRHRGPQNTTPRSSGPCPRTGLRSYTMWQGRSSTRHRWTRACESRSSGPPPRTTSAWVRRRSARRSRSAGSRSA